MPDGVDMVKQETTDKDLLKVIAELEKKNTELEQEKQKLTVELIEVKSNLAQHTKAMQANENVMSGVINSLLASLKMLDMRVQPMRRTDDNRGG